MNEESTMEHMTMERERLAAMERPMEFTSMMPGMRTKMMPRMGNSMNHGRDRLPWSQEIWNRIDQAVHAECQRTKIAAKFLPMYGPISPSERTVPADRVVLDGETLNVDETEVVPIVELVAEFKLTLQQVESEQEDMTAVTLATRAANHLAQAEDLLIFQGQDVTKTHHLFTSNQVRLISGNAGKGLVNAPELSTDPSKQIVPVPPLAGTTPPMRWGENTFAAVADAYSRLQGGDGLAQAHYGPYALVLQHANPANTSLPPVVT